MSELSGVTAALVNTKSSPSGLQVETTTTIDVTLDPGATVLAPAETSTVVEVSLEPGFSVPDPAALGEYLLHVAWSAETKEANWGGCSGLAGSSVDCQGVAFLRLNSLFGPE